MSDTIVDKKKLVDFFMRKNILITPDILEEIEKVDNYNKLFEIIQKNIDTNEFMILNKDINSLLKKGTKVEANWNEFEKSKTSLEKKKNVEAYSKFVDYLSENEKKIKEEKQNEEINRSENKVEVIFSYDNLQKKKREIQDFVSYLNARFRTIEGMLNGRSELVNLMSIQRLKSKKERDTVSIIGVVSDKQYTKNKNLILDIEDPTGTHKVLVNLNKPELFEKAKDIVFDEVIGVVGQNGENILFSNDIIWPDVPRTKELKKAPDEVYAVFLSDIHVGSNNFLEEEFVRFLKWMRGEIGNEKQKETASKIKYVFIAGDLVDGVGIYPDQESELVIKDIYDQYKKCAELLSMIPKDKQIILCPGNHDAMRIAEPQMVIYKDIAPALYELENVTMVSNPALINIHSSEEFPGFDVLMYHGYCFDYYASEVESIRNNGGYDRADLIMKFLIKRRHLAPAHSSTLYSPDVDEDSLVIKRIPDIFVTGHIHKCAASSYRNVSLICGSCWQAKTSFQEKVGHHPEPCRVPIVNLKDRSIRIMKFGD